MKDVFIERQDIRTDGNYPENFRGLNAIDIVVDYCSNITEHLELSSELMGKLQAYDRSEITVDEFTIEESQ